MFWRGIQLRAAEEESALAAATQWQQTGAIASWQ